MRNEFIICRYCGIERKIIPSQKGRMKFCSVDCRKKFTKEKRKTPVTQKTLIDVLDYNPITGIFVWKTAPGYLTNLIGERAGWLDELGYRHIRVNMKLFLAHRLAWLYVYGSWPEEEIDHINGIPGDDRIENLRQANRNQNTYNTIKPKNNTSGFKGVCRKRKRWRAYITLDGKQRNLGVFDSPEEAHEAYVAAAHKLHGEFACDGTR